MDFKDLDHLSFEVVAHRGPNYGILKDTLGEAGSNADLDSLLDILELPNKKELIKQVYPLAGVGVSENAGGHMCETVLRDLIRLSNSGSNFQPCFIHVPHTKDILEDSKLLEEHKNYLDIEKQKSVLMEVVLMLSAFRINNY
jgi:hypothetical protein